MDIIKYRRSIGGALCTFFGAYLLSYVLTLFSNPAGLSASAIIWMAAELVCCGAMLFVAFNKSQNVTTIGRLGAIVLVLTNVVLCLNSYSSVFADASYFSFLGYYFSLVVFGLELVAAVLLFSGIKTGALINIFAILFFVAKVCGSFIISKFAETTDVAEIQSLLDIFSIFQGVALIGVFGALIVTIVWMVKKPKGQQFVESNTEDIL